VRLGILRRHTFCIPVRAQELQHPATRHDDLGDRAARPRRRTLPTFETSKEMTVVRENIFVFEERAPREMLLCSTQQDCDCETGTLAGLANKEGSIQLLCRCSNKPRGRQRAGSSDLLNPEATERGRLQRRSRRCVWIAHHGDGACQQGGSDASFPYVDEPARRKYESMMTSIFDAGNPRKSLPLPLSPLTW
jgi:hypothetical protein